MAKQVVIQMSDVQFRQLQALVSASGKSQQQYIEQRLFASDSADSIGEVIESQKVTIDTLQQVSARLKHTISLLQELLPNTLADRSR
jgi:hypothetical protein